MNPLKEWLQRTCTTQVELSKVTNIPQGLLSKYVGGGLIPGLKNALRIQYATDSQVPVMAWLSVVDSRKKKRKKKVA